ncbi:MAG: lipoprotein insertase outer membrane protein LolB [Methylophilaceae bacterium]|nr:lipoprotein insertase outer membrane protein LolB [Methylophilaceae bacterium]
MRLALIPFLLLAGCAILPSPPPTQPPPAYAQHLQRIEQIRHFALVGRIAILTETKGFSGSIRWHHHSEGDAIAFYSPLGTQVGQLNSDADGVTLTTASQQTYQADDAETLTQQTLGWSLPLHGLPDWVLGRPAGQDAEILAWDEAGRIARMKQSGWEIEYPSYHTTSGTSLPSKVLLKSRKLDLKLVIDDWQTDAN